MKGQFVVILAVIFAFAGCKEKETTGNNSLSAASFAEMISEPSEKIILDVRTPEEFNEGHLQYARLINFYDQNFKEQVNALDKQLPVFVYCASGVRSDKAATILKQEGFREVYVLEKGLKDWNQSELFK